MKYKIKNTSIRIAKGISAILIIKILYISTFMIVNSCQNYFDPKLEIQQESTNMFKNTIAESIKNFSKIEVLNNFNNRQSHSDFESACIYSNGGTDLTLNDLNISEIGDALVRTDVDVYIEGSDGNQYSGELIGCVSVPIEPTIESMRSSIHQARKYLKSHGLTDSDINYLISENIYGPALEEAVLVPTVMLLIAEEQRINNSTSFNFEGVFGSKAYASQVGECVGDALGISSITAVINEGIRSKAGKKLLAKAVRKVATRTLGWVGAAIFAYEFGDCMGWW